MCLLFMLCEKSKKKKKKKNLVKVCISTLLFCFSSSQIFYKVEWSEFNFKAMCFLDVQFKKNKN